MAFSILPVEVNANIAGYLDSDSDLCSFSLICRNTHDSITCDGSPIWREFFARHYDLVPNVSNNDLREAYQLRRKVLRRGAHFRDGNSRVERDCLGVLQDLVLESFSNARKTDGASGPVSLNLQALRHFACSFGITQAFSIPPTSSRTKSSPMMLMQIMLAHLQFDLEINSLTFGFPDAQKAMYATAQKRPIFIGSRKNQVNLQFVNQAINFWSYHFKRAEEQTLCPYYKDLVPGERIKAWKKPLGSSINILGQKWKGVYCYLEPDAVVKLRKVPDDEDDVAEDIFNNMEDGDTPFQTLQLRFTKPKSKKSWPALFEHHLHSLSIPLEKPSSVPLQPPSTRTHRTRAQSRRAGQPTSSSLRKDGLVEDQSNQKSVSSYFHASGTDEERFYATGWLNSLPPQQGVPGMQRFTMMKYFLNGVEDNVEDEAMAEVDPFGMQGLTALDNSSIDESSLWAYEGVVLPGGELIVGRWWSPRHSIGEDGAATADEQADMYSGPFMFWCIGGSEAEI